LYVVIDKNKQIISEVQL